MLILPMVLLSSAFPEFQMQATPVVEKPGGRSTVTSNGAHGLTWSQPDNQTLAVSLGANPAATRDEPVASLARSAKVNVAIRASIYGGQNDRPGNRVVLTATRTDKATASAQVSSASGRATGKGQSNKTSTKISMPQGGKLRDVAPQGGGILPSEILRDDRSLVL